jgi:hypothetical protein
MRSTLALLLVASSLGCHRTGEPPATTGAGVHTAVPSKGGYLRWNFERMDENRAGPVSASWIDANDRVVWTKRMPGRIGAISICCWDAATDAYLRDPRHSDYATDLAPLVLDDALVIEQEAQMLVLALSDGRTLFEWRDERTVDERGSDDEALVDEGSLTLEVAGKTCTTDLRSQNFVRACGGELVYFDRGQLGVFSIRPYKLVAMRRIRGTGQDCDRATQKVERSETIGDVTLRVQGVRLTQCVH